VGAGTGATVGKILGASGWMKGGVGLAGVTLEKGAVKTGIPMEEWSPWSR